jgi:hypothetical protein
MPSFPDSRSRPLDERFGERPSVLDFIPQSQHGAVRDGSATADLTGWIQDGLNSLETAGGGILYLPWGVYPVVDIDLPSNVTLVGDGPAKTVLKRRANLPAGRGVLNISGVNSGFEELAIDGQVTTPQVALYSSLSDPSSTALTANSSVRIHPGAKDISLRRFRIFHSGGYAVHIDARTGDVYRIEIDEPHLHDNRPWLFGAVSGSEIYGAWPGGILAQGDGLSNNYAVRGLKVTGGKFRRGTGNQIWSHVYGFGTLHSDFRIQGNSFEDIGRDGIMIGAVVGGDVSGNNFRRIGYVATDDTSPAVPRWINGQWAVGLDTAGLTRGVNYRGNTFVNCYGAAMDLDGFAEGVVDGNTVIVSLSGEPEYSEDSVASWAGNYCYGAQVSNTNDLAAAGVGVKVTGNRFRNCGLGAIRMYASRRGTVSGNTIEHPAGAAVAPIILGNVGAGDNKRAYGNTVTDNDIYYSPGSPVGVVQEDANGFNFTSADVNRVYGNRMHGTNTFEFFKHSTSGSRTAQEFASAKSALTAESKNVVQREDGYWRGYWVEAGVSKAVFSLLDRVSLSGGGFGGALWNVSTDAVGGVITTGARTTSAFDDAVLSSKFYADGFLAVAATTFAGAEANLLPDTVGLIRYNATSKIFEQSTAVSAGARVWTALAGSSLSGLTAGRIPYTTGASAIADSANLAWDNAGRVMTVTGVTGTASIVAATSFIQAAEGFYTPSGSSAAIGAPNGGVTALSLISVRNDGAAGLTLSRTSATARNYGLGIDSAGALFVRDETGSAVRFTMSTAGLVTIGSSVAIDQAGNLSASATVAAAGVNVSGTAFNSLQVPSGGLYTGLGVTVDQAVYLKTFAGTPNNPGAGYGGWSHRSGSTYLYWNGSAWTTVDLTTVGAGVTSLAGTANQVSVSAATGAVALSLPQNIHTGAAPTFAGVTLTSSVIMNVSTNQGLSISDGTIAGIFFASGLGGMAFGSTSTGSGGHPVIFLTNNTDRGRITAAGNWLIATGTDDTSGAKLQVSGFVRATTGFATPSTATDAIQATAGGVTSKFLIGTTSLTLTGETAANAGLSGSGQGRIYYDSTSNKFRVSQNGGAYVDLVGATGVTSLTGTANQVSVSASTGAVTLSLPQNIHTGATPTFSGLTANGIVTVAADSSSLALAVRGRASDNLSTLEFQSNAGSVYANWQCSASGAAINTVSGVPLDFGIGGSLRGRITAAGNWLVGTGTDDTSGAKLQVNGFVRATNGFATPSTATDAIQATAGGVTSKFLIGTTSLTLVAETAANAGLSGTGQVRFYFDSTSNKVRVSENGAAYVDLVGATGVTSLAGTANQVSVSAATGAVTLSLPQNIHTGASPTFAGMSLSAQLNINTSLNSGIAIGGSGQTAIYYVSSAGGPVIGSTSNHPLLFFANNAQRMSLSAAGTLTVGSAVAIDQSGNLTATATITANGVNVIAGSPVYNTLQTNGGMYAVLGATVDQALYLKTFAGTPNSPGGGYGAISHRSGSTYLYWNGSAWATFDFSASLSGAVLTTTNQDVEGFKYFGQAGSDRLVMYRVADNQMGIQTMLDGQTDPTTYSYGGLANALVLQPRAGIVGIGTLNSSYNLYVDGTLGVSGTSTFAGVVGTVFNSTATGTTIGFQTSNSNFQVNGNGVVSSAGGYNAGGVNVIDASRNVFATTLQTTGAAAIGSTDLTTGALFVRATNVFGLRINNSGALSSTGGAGIQAAIESSPASGDRLAFYTFGLFAGGVPYNSAAIAAFATQSWTPGAAHGTEMRFETTANGSASRSVRLTIAESGLVTIGSTVSIDQSGNVTASATVQAAGVNVTGGSYNSLQCASGGVFTRSGHFDKYIHIAGNSGVPTATSGTSAPVNGMFYYDTSLSKFRAYEGGAWKDMIGAAGVSSLTGTSNQVSVSASTGAVTLSLPQNIHTGASPTFAGVTAGAFSATATGSSIGFQTSNFNFQVDGNGNISGAGSANMTQGYRIGGTTVIDSSRAATNLASATAAGVFQSQATGTNIAFQTTNFNFQVNGNGVVSSAGGYNVSGVNVINTSRQFIGYGVDVGSYGINAGGYNVNGGYSGQTWNVVGSFTIGGIPYTTLVFRGGILVSAS